MTHFFLMLFVFLILWGVIGASGWLFCMVILWGEYDLGKIDQNDKDALYLMTICGVVSWFIILQLMLEDMRKGKKIKFKFPKYKTKGQKFLEKLES